MLRYGAHSSRLRDAVAALSRRLANTIVPWNQVRALVSNRLIALDKCPGVRPIGVGETLRRVVGKAVCMATRIDIEDLCGVDQLCGGLRSGIEGAVHAMNDLFAQHSDSVPGWGVLLVDASNAFNSLNRSALLWNARILWPRCSRFLFNTYRGWAVLFVRGSAEYLYSREGVTQGDPLSMFLYAIGILPLIRSLKDPSKWTQVWYADDASACGELSNIRKWFDLLLHHGPLYGYFPNPSKCCVVVDPSCYDHAVQLFSSLGVQIVLGHRFLGGYLGDTSARDKFVSCKVQQWVSDVSHLSQLAVPQPQGAFAALTRCLQGEWVYLQRVIPGCSSLFSDLTNVLLTSFLPALFGCEISSLEQKLFSLPVRFGGLGISVPTASAVDLYTASRHATQVIVSAIKQACSFQISVHDDMVFAARKAYQQLLDRAHNDSFSLISSSFDQTHQRVLQRAKDNDLAVWLSVTPVENNHFDLSAQEFRDALAIRYRKPLLNLPPKCDGCGAPSSLDHFLICRRGGLVVQRHNEIRDAIGDLAALAWGQVRRETVVIEAEDQQSETLDADLCVRWVWLPQAEALFDIRVVDTDAQSYLRHAPSRVLLNAEVEKKNKYAEACAARRAHFTPLCFSVDGLAGSEANCFLKRMACRLSSRWDRSYAEVLGWIRARLAFAIVRASVLCVRGSRTKWRSLGLEDGAAIDLN